MKKLSVLLLVMVMVLMFGANSYANVIVFRPLPGNNDGTDDGSANAGKDAYTRGSSLSSTNYGGNQYLVAGAQATGGDCRGLIEFNIDGLPDVVQSVILRLNFWGANGFADNGIVGVFKVTEPWNEMDVTGDNQPAYDSTVYASAEVHNTEEVLEFDITDLYNEWKSGTPNHGLMLNTQGSGSCSGSQPIGDCAPGLFWSSDYPDANYRPMLVVTSDMQTFTNSLGMTFNLVPAGTFTMGSPTSEPMRARDEAQHQVTLTKAFYVQTTEVTQGQWEAVMGSVPSHDLGEGNDYPVYRISYNDALNFIAALNSMGEGYYRLPTEAEWEYAARAGSTEAYANGPITNYTHNCHYEPNLDLVGWYCYNSGSLHHPVAQKDPNNWGLYDVHGNASEFVTDWYGDYPTSPVTDPIGPASGEFRVMRGGSYGNYPDDASRLAFRNNLPEGITDNGFRLVMEYDSDGDGIPDADDACPSDDATGFDVDENGCIDSIGGLESMVESLLEEGVIDEQMEISVLSKIDNAGASADKENICTAISQLEALINQVNAQRGKKISDDAADDIIAYTNSVISWYLDQLPEGESC